MERQATARDTSFEPDLGFQNPATLSAKTLTLISFHEIVNDEGPGWGGTRVRDAAVPALPGAGLRVGVSDDGALPAIRRPGRPMTADKCIGCRYCMWACPWGVPTADWNSLAPKIRKCTHCADRCDQPLPEARNGQPLTEAREQAITGQHPVPACVKACPADALRYGTREEMLAEAQQADRRAARTSTSITCTARRRPAARASCTCPRCRSTKLGFPTLGDKPFPNSPKTALGAVPPAVMALGATARRRPTRSSSARSGRRRPRRRTIIIRRSSACTRKLLTPFNWVLLVLMAIGVLSIVSRFVLGLGGSTNLSDTYPWGLWIVFDLVWIALAAGAFATAGLIYVFQRKDLYSLGPIRRPDGVPELLVRHGHARRRPRAAVALLPARRCSRPEHSAMFEVSWCVGLYVTILLLEFLPVPLEHFGYARAVEIWRRWYGRLRRVRGDAVRLHAVAQPRCTRRSPRGRLRHTGLAVPRAREARRADSAGHRRGHAVDDAPELAGVAVSS